MKTYENRDPPRLDNEARRAIETALRRHATVQVMLTSGGRVQVLEVEKKILYRAP